MSSRISWSLDDGVAEIVLTGAERLNAIDLQSATELQDAVTAITSNDAEALKVLFIRAEGRHFCAGGDLKTYHAQGDELPKYLGSVGEGLHQTLQMIRAIKVPVVVAAQGAIAGAGIGLALSGDLLILADTASIQLAYTAVGLSPDNGSTYLLPRLLGERLALELMLTNRSVKAPEALSRGIATEVVEADNLEEKAREIVAKLGALSTDALIASKRLVKDSCNNSLSEQLDREAESIIQLAGSDAGRQAIAKFVEG